MRVNGYAAADDGTLQVTRTCSPPGLAIAGEIDESNYADLIAAMTALADWPDAEVHVNLSGVTYCDLAGLRAIIRITTGRDCYGADSHAGPADHADPNASHADRAGPPADYTGGSRPESSSAERGDVGRRHVVLHAVSPELTAVLRILGWDKLPDLAISERTVSVPPQPRSATGTGLHGSASR